MQNVNSLFDKSAHSKCSYWGQQASSLYLFLVSRWFILKELCVNRSQRFSLLQFHYITGMGWKATKKKNNWRHATVRTGAWARAE